MRQSPNLIFEVIQDISLYDLENTLSQNQRIVSITNDYEDGQWRTDKFLSYIIDNITQTALSFEERKKTIANPFSALKFAIDHLRKAKKRKMGLRVMIKAKVAKSRKYYFMELCKATIMPSL